MLRAFIESGGVGGFRIVHGRPALAAVLVLFACLATTKGAQGHEAFEERLARVEAQLAQQPGDPELLLKRGDLYVDHKDFTLARADYLQAMTLGIDPVRAHFALGWLELLLGNFAESLGHYDEVIATSPEHPAALAARGRAYLEAGQPTKAYEDFDRLADLRGLRTVELFLLRARAATEAGRISLALDGLALASQELGHLTVIEQEALRLELASGDFHAALARVDLALEASPRPELWAVIRGDVLLAAHNPRAAEAAYRRALDRVLSKQSRRSTQSLEALAERARNGIALASRGGQQ